MDKYSEILAIFIINGIWHATSLDKVEEFFCSLRNMIYCFAKKNDISKQLNRADKLADIAVVFYLYNAEELLLIVYNKLVQRLALK